MTPHAQPHAPGSRPSIALLAVAFLLAVGCLAAEASGPRSPASRVRAADPKAAELLATGTALSPAVAGLVDTLDESDLIVYVETALLRERGLRGKCGAMRIVASTPAGRFVRITVNVPGIDVNLIAALGHELQHAVEVAADPTVTDADTLLHCYKSRGFRKPDGTYCTREATRVASVVRAEVARSLTPRSP